MHLLVTRKIPEVIKIGADELSSDDTLILNMLYKTDRSEFVVSTSGKEKILVNKSLDSVNEIVTLIDQIMGQKYLDTNKTEKMFDRFCQIAGEKAETTLFHIWRDWREERRKAEAKEQAEKDLLKAKNRRLKRYLKNRENTANETFSIGFGTYDPKARVDFQKGIENVFLYGYLCCLEDIERKRIKGFCVECG